MSTSFWRTINIFNRIFSTKKPIPGCQDNHHSDVNEIKYQQSSDSSERSILFSAFQKGSVTIEAAVILPVFLLVSSAVISLFSIMALQLKIQSVLNRTAEKLAVSYGVVSTIAEEEIPELIKKAADFFIISSISERNIQEETGKEIIQMNGIRNLSYLGSGLREEEQLIIVRVSYTAEIPFLSGMIPGIRFSQQACRRVWCGDCFDREYNEPDEEMVYVTEKGSVYHLYLSCRTLNPGIKSIDAESIGDLRNMDGAIYYPCRTCTEDTDFVSGAEVFYTPYGTAFHINRNCSGLKRNIKAIPLGETDLPLCSYCKKTKNKEK